MYPWQATVQDDAGNAVPFPFITVYGGDGSLASIYDESGAALSNPLTGTIEGFVQFWANEGEYRIEGASGGQETEVWSWIAGPVASVRYDAAQTLTGPEKTQALSNIGAQPAGGYLRYDAAQTLTAAQMKSVSKNGGVIGADYKTYDRRGSRNVGVTYTNTKAWPILVSATFILDAAARKLVFAVSGMTVSWFEAADITGSVWWTVTGLVPPSATYRVDGVGIKVGSETQSWIEWDLT